MNDAVEVDVAIVGAGQAGLSLSFRLTELGIEHVVLERGAIAESWRSSRWDSFCLVTPNWTVRLAGEPYRDDEPDGFMGRDALVAYLARYAASFDAPVMTGVDVTEIRPALNAPARSSGGSRGGGRASSDPRPWEVVTRSGPTYSAQSVVIATATHQRPRWPQQMFPTPPAGIQFLHASAYRSEAELPRGTVVVVGSGQSGTQLALELHEAGREVVLSTSRVGRLPRRYRGKDAIGWQADMGFLDRHARALETPAHRFNPDPHLSGRNGGETLDLRAFARRGISLAGRLTAIEAGHIGFGDELPQHLVFADQFARNFAQRVDSFIAEHGVDAPPPETVCPETFSPQACSALGFSDASPVTVLWATGFEFDFSWIDAPDVFDAQGYPQQAKGRTVRQGLHFLGLNYVEHRRSGILYGAGRDAAELASVIARDLGINAIAPPEWLHLHTRPTPNE